jgi:type IX secretion system PorP/SprF family membrane protein
MCCALSCFSVSAQLPQHSQYYQLPLLLAPSFAGNSLGSRAFVSYRDQWARLPGSYVTYSVAFDNNFYALNSGFGIVAMHDVAGSTRYGTTSVKALYSYRFNMTDDWRIRPGIAFSFGQRGIFGRTVFGDQISITGTDPTTMEPPVTPYNYFDATSSVVVYNSRMWFGLSVDRLMRPSASINRLDARAPMYWTQFGGINYSMQNRVGKPAEVLTFHYILKSVQNVRQMDLGVNWYHAPLLMGIGWRGLLVEKHSYDAIIFKVGVAFNNIAFGYSYDYTVSGLSSSSGGSHEITLSISFNEGSKNQRRDAIPCPDVVKFRMFGDKESFR